ncbi:PREDICTED: Fanconi anemia group J protein homolog [Camelina sativa]|uniref:Fanconi anemia group J protein homolog n=1 Tax=Camelina sativa TaxID=90675 RepID=A0ABM1R5Y4_CAMSA|nr:PREDICTED: Fanconi anemia group J protein homolog [Camelina sativa]
MVSTTSKSDSKDEVKQTLNPENPKKLYQIGGLQVEFPYQPYGTQLAFMSRVISTLDRAQRDGHSHALLESPTGTGKSLSLLCSVLAWQKSYLSRFSNGNFSHLKTQPSDTTLPSNVEPPEPPNIPTIYYASRTHAQISQVIREYKKTGYRVPMAVLGSRKRCCTNRHVQGKDNVDEKCRLLLKDKKNPKCPEFEGAARILAYPSLRQNGHNGVHDIEDLVKIGKTVIGCPYFASRKMLEVAKLVFCPYSYIIDPVIRGGINLKGAIKLLKPCYNMEDIAREAGSINLEEDIIIKLRNELEKLSDDEPEFYEPLYEVVEGLISWIGSKKDSLAKRDSEHYFSNWTGDRALKELKEFNITPEYLPQLQACLDQAITKSEAAEMDPDKPYLSGISVTTLEELFATLTYFFSKNGSHVLDYEMGLLRSARRGTRDTGWTHTFSLWCMNPSVVFKDLADLSLSIILTSGTLSPMNSFSSELGLPFATCLEAPHVIDPNLQVWAGAISSGPGNYPLNASYKTADAYEFQDTLGKSLEEICNIVPGGSLVFFPSYKLMEKLCTRWRETGQWSRLCLKRDLFIEPRGGATDDFETVLKEYYDSISGKNRLIGRNRRVKKAGSVVTEAQDDYKKGSAFLAVCRGKVSEGLDFSDEKARAVIIVGIPFPNLHDILVELKRKYNDTYKSSKNLLGGGEWYCQQAYRALNQAAGRCIRHRFDYGAIIFLDERYRQPRNRASISKWLRQSIKLYDNFEASMEGLRYFFSSVKEQVNSKMLESHEQNLSSENQSKEFIKKENQIQNNSSHVEPKDIASRRVVNVEDYTSSNPRYSFTNEVLIHNDVKPKIALRSRSMRLPESYPGYVPAAHTFIQVKKETESFKGVIDLDCEVQTEPGYCEVSSVTNCDEDPETSSVSGIATASPGSSSKNESSSLATGLRSMKSPDQFLKRHISTENFRKSPLGTESSVLVTPERYSIGGDTRNSILEAESPLNMSVNSNALKRRKFSSSPVIIDLEEEEYSNAPSTEPADHTNFTRKIEFGFGSTESRSQNENTYAFQEVNQRVMRISCSLCRSSLGHPENDSHPKCLLTSSSKAYLLSLLKEASGIAAQEEMPTSVSVIMTDCSLVNQRLCTNSESSKGQGIWCQKDGCVYNTIFCPFCSVPNTCLGVQVMATNSSNVQLMSKILFFADHLEVKNDDASKETALKHKFGTNGDAKDVEIEVKLF